MDDIVVIEAYHVNIVDILRKLEAHDVITVRNWPTRSSRLRTGRWQGKEPALLAQILREMSDEHYLIKHNMTKSGVYLEVVFLESSLGRSEGARKQPRYEEIESSRTLAADRAHSMKDQTQDHSASSITTQYNQKSAALFNVRQATFPTSVRPTHVPKSIFSSRALTQSVFTNVQALARSLRTACIGNNCASGFRE